MTSEDSRETQWRNVTSHQPRHRLKGLLPHQRYRLRVRAENRLGVSPPSQELLFTTKEGGKSER